MNFSRWALLAFIAALVAVFFAFDLQHYLTLEMLKLQQAAIEAYRADHPVLASVVYALIYIAVTGLSLPGATVLTLAGGAVFGLLWGTLIVSFASTIGATLAFLAARFLFSEAVKSRFGDRLNLINKGMDRQGALYLFTLRLVPVFPFFVINLVMGLTNLKAQTFYWVSQVGMLAGTVVYVNAGTQLGKLESLSGILSPGLIGSFALLGVFPLLANKIVEAIKANKVYAQWVKPARFDSNIVVIGAGSGGLVTAYIAAAVKAKVTLIEKHKMGGDCLNTGCVPSKALIRSARLLAQMRRSADFGIKKADAEVNFAEVMSRVQSVVKAVEPHDSVQRYTDLGVEVIEGEATIISPWEVQVKTAHESRIITTRSIVIAAGARPFVPPIPGIEHIGYLTSDTVWDLRELPKRLVVLGGGPIGCELAQSFARLGSEVTQVEMLPRLLVREDSEVSEAVMATFRLEGIHVLVEHTAKGFIIENGEKILFAEHDGKELRIPFDNLLLAIGRVANIQGYGLEQLGVDISAGRAIEINEFQQTNYPNIFACGDVSGPFQFTHTAAHQAWYALVNALFGSFIKFRTDYSVIPWATFTDPEVARVGLNEQDAKAKGVVYELSTYHLDDLDRAIADGVAHGFVKVLTAPGNDRILGVTIVGEQAGELIAEFVLAMKHNIGLNKLLDTIHIYPTLSEANKYAAGVWKRNHAPKGLLWCIARYHDWRRR
ncbi:pyruvate/2-oxoglutarate dehydrogenase complex dihydrolipoamide dehydrogenase (E3) component [Methylobacter tundripaludum]|uniref:Pyruvate/2-oxoglutarate dehydrogenase complex dihydrolipoamide dehydrogenase (E3) component n=1 Tax=Methylobacter tundripaludum TaxID=173365 RepID=A0A2S6H798_9GAMM|nr:bifunctional TVP38/TMEM64 family protein/FAD-dependent oxidoreductase [Methylobacter tundripaludum]PPK73355.1 pyruvate/2-oxoglutarate dehydrogenase complex dihydrolipoamide dehydrogenase (E3) component [Methylobacter tundripaludum]